MYDEMKLKPLEYYQKTLKETHSTNTKNYFEKLVKESGVDKDENKKVVSEYNKKVEEVNNVDKKISKLKSFKTFSILAIIVFAIALICLITPNFDGNGATIIGIVFAIIAIVGIVLVSKKFKSKINNASELHAKLSSEATQLLNKAEEQMAPLNALFKSTDVAEIIKQTYPELDIHPAITPNDYNRLVDYGFFHSSSEDEALLKVLTGEMHGTPFCYRRKLSHEIGQKDYHGSLTIEWVEYRQDSNGNVEQVRKTQTLRASVLKPYPLYNVGTTLYYVNETAPNLEFQRTPNNVQLLNEKQIAKRVKDGQKKLEKKTRKATKTGGQYMEMANPEFEVLFGADDRNDEVQFRMMFTPLAQKNMVEFLCNKECYGDDFYWGKLGTSNHLSSEHMHTWDMSTYANEFKSYDFEQIESKFYNKNVDFFKHIYSDFAPMLSVPLYQQQTVTIEKNQNETSGVVDLAAEVSANALEDSLKHVDSKTDSIIKVQKLTMIGDDTGIYGTTAYSYDTEECVDYVSVKGDDGYYHDVPVYWIRYIPIEKSGLIAIKRTYTSDTEFYKNVNVEQLTNGCIDWAYSSGYVAGVIRNESDAKNFDSIVKK